MRNSDNPIPSPFGKRRQSKMEVRLNRSLQYRSAHKDEAKTTEIPDETSEKYFHPERQGLFCDAPLGLKY
ncbi:MAG: hypothetical protein JWO95_1219 [Verrucomicrobiales bacterium]|nr:hypothetical protein [Verrucomicrobiales bacterium]